MLSENIKLIKNDINQACKNACRNPEEIILMGASKSQTVGQIEQAYEKGVFHFGENYLQEAEPKISKIEKNIIWHFIGSIQTKKTKKIAHLFDWVHTVDSLKIAEKLNDARPSSRGPLNICLQVNIDNEETKSGILKEEIDGFLTSLTSLKNIKTRGLMIIPKPRHTAEEQSEVFSDLKLKLDSLKSKFPELDTLSMGMSSDYLVAIQEGATILRIGTGIFGARK
ncbi:MAG TPA: YggS family pyridoxal phosphate-dependent enzyme [SAR86 cluster bacterium]|nr:YggS family pyridoxal phosphate-dependent enzyme [SAR86 cluster bacterium]HJM15472.1 YggS family pyridoxal phosphate-dependent enzyme [SAR86 cluster bacterium]